MATVLADQQRVRFYRSPDLIHWEHLSDFGPAGSTAGEWECPDLFPLSIEGEQNSGRWVLKVDVGPRNLPHGLCGQYFIGQFDGIQFVNDNPPDLTLWADHGMDFYAVQSWSDVPAADGRRLWLAWMNNWRYANTIPTSPWRGAMTVPRSVALRRYPEGLRLVQRPVVELTGCRCNHFGRAGLSVADTNRQLQASGMAGDALEIIADFRLTGATEVGLRVRSGDGEATVVGYDAVAQRLFVDRTHAGDASFSPDFPDRHAAALTSVADRISLHVFVDRCSVELFGGGGRAVITDLIFPSPGSTGLELYALGGEPVAERLDIWALQP
jgi:fructan beta-fructosidase